MSIRIILNEYYFSDRDIGTKPRINEVISTDAWGGIVSVFNTLVDKGSFGIEFPEVYRDNNASIGTDGQKLSLAVRAEIPDLPWPVDDREVPPKLSVLDLIEFCHKNIAKPVNEKHHPFYDHYHLGFDREGGQAVSDKKLIIYLLEMGLSMSCKKMIK